MPTFFLVMAALAVVYNPWFVPVWLLFAFVSKCMNDAFKDAMDVIHRNK
jgi:hypothetical protein